MKLNLTAVYANLPLATTEAVTLKLTDATTLTHFLMMIVDWKRGKRSPFVKITFTDSDVPQLRAQGIETEGLTHFVYEMGNMECKTP